MNEKTQLALMYLKDSERKVRNVRKDPDKDYRRHLHLCQLCFYIRSGGGGQAITAYTCQKCRQEKSHSDTVIPRHCPACCEKDQMCGGCGADIDLPV